jgi:GTPase SAR1 family protein
MRQDNINMIETLLKQGISDAKELSKKSGLSINRVYEIKKELGYGKKRRQENSNNQEPKPTIKEEEKTTPKTETIHNTNKISDEMKRYIPQMNGFNKYIERKLDDGKTDFEIIEALYKMNKPLLLVGDTGCGKTHAVWHFAYKKGNFDGSTTPEEFIGKWTPNKNGGFEWVDGLLTKFVRNGGVFVIDELNSGSPDLMFFLHPLLDDEKKIVLLNNGGEVIHAHKNFYLVATMNPDYEGTKPLNQALQDRFEIIEFDYDEKVERKLISSRKLLKFAQRIRDTFRKGEIVTPLSTRGLISYEKNLSLFGKNIARTLLLNKFKTEERQSVGEVFDLVMNDQNEKDDAVKGEEVKE